MAERTSPGGKPNVVLVITDDQGYGDLGCHGNEVIRTPNIDRLHGESVRLTNFHVGPTCAPTRAGLMTGRYCNCTGVWHTIAGRSLIRRDEVTMADVFAAGGYRTGIFGKWHLGDNYPFRPQDRGFQDVLVHGGGGVSQTPDYWGNDYFDDTYFRSGVPESCTGYCTDVWFDEAMKFIEAGRDRPFFCYLPTNAPHGPYNVADSYSRPYRGLIPDQRANFYGMITNIDDNVGRLRAKLAELGIEENTILIWMTDNGTSAGCSLDENEFVREGFNAGMRGMKGSAYDGGHRT
ncbi:MAG: arylsulfatase, partial [Phycisphaerae bacterium]